MEKLRVAVLFGGCSTEYEVSLQSAEAVLAHLDTRRFAPLTVGITKQGKWLYYTGPFEHIADGTWHTREVYCTPCMLCPDRGTPTLLVRGQHEMRYCFDAAFPVMHGKNGEDGTVQGLLEMAGVPVVGCGTLASALCMDKDKAHKLAALAGVEVPRSAVFSRRSTFAAIQNAAQLLGWPLFVKPVCAGSSFGITRVEQPQQLATAVEAAFRHDSQVLLEEAVPGFEVGCAVMGNGELFVGEVDEIELSGGFFDYEEKYTLKTSRIHCPARIGKNDAERIKTAARTVYRALGCRVFARVDLFLTPQGKVVFNEINTIPGFTAHSRYPGMMRAAGLPFGELITRLVELGVEK